MLSLRRQRFRPAGAKSKSVAPDSAAYVPPQPTWTAEELAVHDGRASEDGPVLLAADGLVFNVARSRNFYGPGGEYAVMAGVDATRYLARNSVEPETAAQAATELNVAQRASLATWTFSLKQRYDVVGKLATADEAAAIARRERESDAYFQRMDELSANLEVEPPPS